MSEKPNKAEKGKKQKNKIKERVLTWDYDLVARVLGVVHIILVVFYTVENFNTFKWGNGCCYAGA